MKKAFFRGNDRRIAVGYVRVSADERDARKHTIASQHAMIEAFGVARGISVNEVVIERESTVGSLTRPGLYRILLGIQAGSIGSVIVGRLESLTRSSKDLAELLDLFALHEVAFISVAESLDTSSGVGRVAVNLFNAVMRWEREAVAARTSIGLADKRSQGLVYGPIPFGYRRDGQRLIIDSQQQEAISEAIRLRKEGYSYRGIAAYLTSAGHLPRRGKAWYASSIRAMLSSKILLEGRSGS